MPESSSSTELYRHTQFGAVMAFALAGALLSLLGLGFFMGWPMPLLGGVVIVAGLLVAFYSLTTVVTDGDLKVAFGPGWVSKTIPLGDIKNATPDRSHVLWGWGIRYWPGRGWMWNVSGFDVVVLELPDGREFRVGTNDPEGLAGTIQNARAALA